MPGLSEVEAFDDMQAIEDYGLYNSLKRLIRTGRKYDIQRVQELAGIFLKLNYDAEVSVMEFINLLADSRGFPWYYSRLNLFITALHYL